jgi:hypothetical protein
MSTPTTLQEVYDSFFIKSIKDYTGHEDKVYQFFKTGVSKSKKTVPTDLTYTVDETTYDGAFTNTLEQDEIELIALNMLLEEKRTRKSELDYMKAHIGTKDFNKLNDKFTEYKILNESMKDLQDEIYALRQEFYSYANTK